MQRITVEYKRIKWNAKDYRRIQENKMECKGLQQNTTEQNEIELADLQRKL